MRRKRVFYLSWKITFYVFSKVTPQMHFMECKCLNMLFACNIIYEHVLERNPVILLQTYIEMLDFGPAKSTWRSTKPYSIRISFFNEDKIVTEARVYTFFKYLQTFFTYDHQFSRLQNSIRDCHRRLWTEWKKKRRKDWDIRAKLSRIWKSIYYGMKKREKNLLKRDEIFFRVIYLEN